MEHETQNSEHEAMPPGSNDTPTELPQERPTEPEPVALIEEPLIASAQVNHAEPSVHIKSKKMLYRIGMVIALLNPIASGVVLGVYLWTEPEMKREGKIITAIAAAWGILSLIILKKTFRGTGLEF